MTNKPITVLFIWQPGEELRQYLAEGLDHRPDVRFIYPPDTEQETFCAHAPEADIIIGWRPTKELLEMAENLKLFINPGAGVKHLIELFREHNKTHDVTVINGHGNSYFTAQHAVAMLMALTNKVVQHHNWMTDGRWRTGDNEAASLPMRDRHIGLLGYGAINRNVHQFLSGFDVNFSICRRSWEGKPKPAIRFKDTNDISQLQDFLTAVDTLMIAIPHTPETEGMIGRKELELLGPEGLLINVGRGIIIDEEALFTALEQKTIAGAGIDVWYNYKAEPDENGKRHPSAYPFHTLDNVILSPHRAASPFSDLKRWDEVVENIRRFADGEKEFLNVVQLEREY
jgi:phosphoglycerate dehydrogenase-like enzyme